MYPDSHLDAPVFASPVLYSGFASKEDLFEQGLMSVQRTMEHIAYAIRWNGGQLVCASEDVRTKHHVGLHSNILAAESAEVRPMCILKETQTADNLLLPQCDCDDRAAEHIVDNFAP